MTELTNIGSQMANVMFNLAQRPGEPLTGETVAMMDNLRKQWDAARRAQPADCAEGLGPLPESKFCAWLLRGKVVNAFTHGVGDPAVWDHDKHWENKGYSRAPLYTAEQVEQIRREAVACYKRQQGALQELAGQAQELGMGYEQPASTAQPVANVGEQSAQVATPAQGESK